MNESVLRDIFVIKNSVSFYQRTGPTNYACCVALVSDVGTIHHDMMGFVFHFGDFAGLTVRVIHSTQVHSPTCFLSFRINMAGRLSLSGGTRYPSIAYTWRTQALWSNIKLLQLFMFLVHRKSTANYRLLQAITAISGNISIGMRVLCNSKLRWYIYTVYSEKKASTNRAGWHLSHRKDTMTARHLCTTISEWKNCSILPIIQSHATFHLDFWKQTQFFVLRQRPLGHLSSVSRFLPRPPDRANGGDWQSDQLVRINLCHRDQWKWTKGLGTPHTVTPHCTSEGEQYCSELNPRPHVISSRDYNTPSISRVCSLSALTMMEYNALSLPFALISFSLTDVLQGL